MSHTLRPKTIALIAALFAPLSLHSQSSPPAPPPGRHEYQVRGVYEGQEMEPWDAELSMIDTTVGGAPGVRALYKSRLRDGVYLFRYAAAWQRANPSTMALQWVNGGRAPSVCRLALEGGRLTGGVEGMPMPMTLTVRPEAVPDFALGAYFAARPLVDGDSIRLSVVRCLPGFNGLPVQVHDVVATVRPGGASRGSAAPEPAWLIEGAARYPFKVWIARADRMVLRAVTPQGSVGESTDTYRRTVP